MSDLRDLIADALVELVDDGDAFGEVDRIFSGVVRALQRDSRFPRLSEAQFHLLFADAKRDAEEDVAAVVLQAITDHMPEGRHEQSPAALRRLQAGMPWHVVGLRLDCFFQSKSDGARRRLCLPARC